MSRTLLVPILVFVTFAPPCAAEIVYPQLALGGGYSCMVLVSNLKDSPWSGQILARQRRGDSWTVNWESLGSSATHGQFSLNLPGDSTRKIVLSTDGTLDDGYLIIRSDSNSTSDLAVSFFYRFGRPDGQLLDSTGVAPGDRGTVFVLPVERGTTVDTGIAWSPAQPSDVPKVGFDFQAVLMNPDGEVVQQKTVSMEGHSALFFSELFDGVPAQFVGKMSIDSPESLYLTALRLESEGDRFQLTSVPPVRLKDEPGGPRNFEIDYDSLFWTDSGMYTGKIKNLSVADAVFPSVSVAFYDAEGNFVGGGWDFVTGETRQAHSVNINACLRPGETGYFAIPMFPLEISGLPDHFEMFVTAEDVTETIEPAGRVEVVELERIDSSGILQFRGELENTGSVGAEGIRVHFFLLDDSGRIVGWDYLNPNRDSLAPGERVSFMILTWLPYSLVADIVASPNWRASSPTTASHSEDDRGSLSLGRAEEILRERELYRRVHPKAGTLTTETISGTIPR